MNHATPTALRIATGNPSGRPLPDHEPLTQPGEPPMPHDLSKAAKRVWREMVPILHELGTLTTSDGDALAAYCETKVTWRMAQDSIEQDGIVIESSQGRKKNPAVTVADSSLKQMRSLLGEFGMTPASRTKIRSESGDTDSPFERLIKEGMKTNTYEAGTN
jgi:P27 family predicted phage terminase small subunit